MDIGRICVKIAGRDAGKTCVVVDNLDKNFVLIDGNTRRRKCNVTHLHPLDKVVKIKAKENHKGVLAAMKAEKIKVEEKKKGTKERKKSEKPKKQRAKSIKKK